MKVTREQLSIYLDISKGHPYYAQLILQQLFLFYIIKKKLPSIDELLDEILSVERDYLEKTWEDLSSNQEYVFILKHLSQNPHGIYGKATKRGINASRSIKKLEGFGILYKEAKGYHFYDPIFELWIAMRIN